MTTLPRFEPGAVFAGDFVVERRLAEGGMGAVYVVEQRSTGHRRALKVMHPDIVADARNRERFTQEARVGSLIRSPYVVEVAAAGVDDATGTPWLLMELLDGESLRERVTRGALPDRAVLQEMFEQLGDALGRAHAAGVVHRDLKPENLFIATSRLRGVPFLMKVLDFGIAAIVSGRKDSATVTTVIGSPMWMAPEQATVGAQVGPPADVWSLGLITFYAMTGRYFWPSLTGPKDNINIAALLVDMVVNPIPAPSARAATLGVGDRLPAGFDAWFARCVTRDPAQRFPEAHAAVDALLPLLASDRPASEDPAAFTSTLLTSSPLFATTSSPPSPSPAPDAPLPQGTLAPPVRTLPEATPAAAPSRRGAVAAALVAVALLSAGAVAIALRGERAPPVTPPRPLATVALDAAPPREAAAADVTAVVDAAVVALDATVAETADATGADAAADARRDARDRARDAAAAAARDAAVVAARDAAAVGDAGLPDRPARAAIEAAFREVAVTARACGVHGRVFVLANFAGDGHVLSASAEREHANTPAGECIARAVRQVRLPPFRRTSILVSQPLDL